MKDILISTTNTIENAEIGKYFGVLSANIVVGTNIFSDLAASFTDFFGGYSNTYQKKIDKIYGSALDLLKEKANRIGADAVIGVKLDISEISGKGKSMLMISAAGTAVKLKYQVDNTEGFSDLEISGESLSAEMMRRDIVHKVQADGYLPTDNEWNFLLKYPIDEIFELLLAKYVLYCGREESQVYPKYKLLVENFPIYAGLVNRELAIRILYRDIQPCIVDLLNRNQLFDSDSILSLLNEGKVHEAILCLSVSNSSYTIQDLRIMQEILDKLSNLSNTGKIEMVKGTFKVSEKFICSNGHKNDPTTMFCEECGLNINGLTKMEVMEIKTFENRIRALEALFRN